MGRTIPTRRKAKVGAPPSTLEQWVHVDTLKPWDKNPRKNDPAVPKVGASIRRFGFVSPIVVWRGGDRLVAGHTRLKAVQAILASEPTFVARGAPAPGFVRVVFHEFADEKEADAFALADNRLATEAQWDDDGVIEILKRLHDEDATLITAAGFSDNELAFLLGAYAAPLQNIEVAEHTRGAGEIDDQGKVSIVVMVTNTLAGRAKEAIEAAMQQASLPFTIMQR